jgi:hypothetical protein
MARDLHSRLWRSSCEIDGDASHWLTVRFARATDLAFVHELVVRAADAHQPAADRLLRPPPAGAELARRRRFH